MVERCTGLWWGRYGSGQVWWLTNVLRRLLSRPSCHFIVDGICFWDLNIE